MHLACSKVLVEGTVQSITPTDDGNVRVVLKVKRYYRPEQSVADHPTITVTLLGSARADLKVGTYTLVRVPVYPLDRQDWETGWGVGDARKGIVEALPGARGTECAGPAGAGAEGTTKGERGGARGKPKGGRPVGPDARPGRTESAQRRPEAFREP